MLLRLEGIAMLLRLASILALVGFMLPAEATADTLWDYQAVDATGHGAHPLAGAPVDPANRVTFTGVTIAGTRDLVDPDGAFAMYTVMVQDADSDRGGIQCWAGPWSKWIWSGYGDIAAGHRVEVSGYLADHNGKVFVNDRHSTSETVMWTVTDLGYVGMPEPQTIPSIAECNYFDASRQGGAERWQTRWVHLRDVTVTSGVWGNGEMLTVTDSSGETLPMLLSGMGDFDAATAPEGPFDVVAVFDQEDIDDPRTGSYRLWVKEAKDIMVLGDFDGNAVLDGLDIPDFKEALADPAAWDDASGRYADILGDFNGDGVMNGLDIPGFKAALAQTTPSVPEPATVVLVALGAIGIARRRRWGG